jgi:hypothetical protein
MTTALGSPLADLIRGALADLGTGPGVLVPCRNLAPEE